MLSSSNYVPSFLSFVWSQGPLSNDRIVQIDPAEPHVRRGAYMVTCTSARTFIKDEGNIFITSMKGMPAVEAAAVVQRVAKMFLEL